jgi:hypothetical protein
LGFRARSNDTNTSYYTNTQFTNTSAYIFYARITVGGTTTRLAYCSNHTH